MPKVEHHRPRRSARRAKPYGTATQNPPIRTVRIQKDPQAAAAFWQPVRAVMGNDFTNMLVCNLACFGVDSEQEDEQDEQDEDED